MYGWRAVVDGDGGGGGGGSGVTRVCVLFAHTFAATADETDEAYDENDDTTHSDGNGSRHTQRQKLLQEAIAWNEKNNSLLICGNEIQGCN